MLKVYIAGPYTKGDVAVNVANAMAVADSLIAHGFAPYCPHLSHFQHMAHPRPYETWLDIDFAWIRCCDFLLRLPGDSEGADREVWFARAAGIPVFHSVMSLVEGMTTAAEEQAEEATV